LYQEKCAFVTEVVTMNHRVALLGTSLAIDMVAAALAAVPELEVLRFECAPTQGLANVQALAPDAVIFDMAMVLPDSALVHLVRHPGLLLIGCDLAVQKMFVFSGASACLDTVDDLLQVLSGGDRWYGHEVGRAT
jgi:hypothetical protein